MATRIKTPKQNRTLGWLLGQAGLYDDDARDALEAMCGKRRRSDMDFDDFKKCIDELNEKLGGVIKKKKPGRAAKPRSQRPGGYDEEPPTPDQLEYIFGLLNEMNFKGILKTQWIKRQIKKPWPQTRGEAKALTETLKQMKARGYVRGQGETKKERS